MGSGIRGNMEDRLWLTPLLILAFLLSSSLHGQDSIPGIRVTLSSKNMTVNQVLDEITIQTGYHFTFNADQISGKERVQFEVNDLTLEETLDSLLHNPRFAYRLIDRNIVIFPKNESAPVPINLETNRSIVRGRVLDSRSGKPLPYATIALYGTSLGSISNQEGEFSFKIPGTLSDPLLVVSYMGYQRILHPVTYPLEGELTIFLERETIPLQEVIIRFADPGILLREALNRIPSNYLDDNSTMTAFYRESVKRNEHCMVYSEAILDVAKGAYTPNSAPDRVRIRQGRKIADVTTEDTVLIKLRSGIYTSFSLDVIKNRPDFLSDDLLERYDLEFTDLIAYGERLVYVISFQQKTQIPELLFRGQLYLDQENLAILAADFEFNPELIHREPELFLVSRSPNIRIRPVTARYHVEYRGSEGNYHVSQVRAELEMKIRKRRKWMGAKYRIAIEMAVTDVIPGQRLRISASERVDPNIVLSDEPFKFDPLFWGIYNSIEPEASLKESIERLQHILQEPGQ